MGNIKKVLLAEGVSAPLFNNRFTTELCENVHVHYRNVRLEFPKEEFLQILRELKQIDEKTVEDFEYGKGNFLSLINKETLPDQCEFNERLQIEEQEEGHYHVHYRNLRLELRDLMDLGHGLFETPIRIDPKWVKRELAGKTVKDLNVKKYRLSELHVGVYSDDEEGNSVGKWVPLWQSPVYQYLEGSLATSMKTISSS
tara:strand:- start:482 stop:1078 length:597 start_codon:yes stop_codon:yes gene_type:complete